MNFIQREQEENSGIVQLLLLTLYALIGFIACAFIAFVILFAMYGMEVLTDPQILTATAIKYRPALQILLVAQSAGLFLLPALLLPFSEGKKIGVFYGFVVPKVKLLAFVLLIMAVSMPMMEWIAVANQQMVLPEFLKPVEDWMRKSEDELMQTTLFLLEMTAVKDLIINILLIALVPAVAEELLFRGAIQRSFLKMFHNPHIAIWVSAFIFSAIHLQFYGFVPRLLLGAGFGYIYVWSGSLWYAIFAHFLNNAYAVCAAWYMQKNNIPLSQADNTAHFAWYGYLASLILTLLAFHYFKRQTTRANQSGSSVSHRNEADQDGNYHRKIINNK